MPFTLSHAVLAVPLSRLSRRRLPIAALAIGCMTPDLLRLFTVEDVTLSHQWSGLVVPNVIIGGLFCLLWYVLYRPVLYRCWALEDALDLDDLNTYCSFIMFCLIAIILGSMTHIFWDGLTHADYRTLWFKPQLSQNISIWGSTYPLHRLLQFASSVLVLPLLFYQIKDYFKQHQLAEDTLHPHKTHSRFIYAALLLSVITGSYLSVHYTSTVAYNMWNKHTYVYAGATINQFATGFFGTFTLCCVVFVLCAGLNRLITRLR